MPLCVLKPIFWNTARYERPSGVKANSGYPQEHGYGHEEWNNSSHMTYSSDGKRFRAFHTESLRNAPVDANNGNIFVFMYASHSRVQQLVGIAGGATCLIDDLHKAERLSLFSKLKLNDLGPEAWRVASVRTAHANDRDRFNRHWRGDEHWIANWKCPDDMYLWLEEPVTMNPLNITGKTKLVSRFNTYTQINTDTARKILVSIPSKCRRPAWNKLYESLGGSPNEVSTDLYDLRMRTDIAPTVREALVLARLGQGKFRADLERRWQSSCAVTGCTIAELLRASHIKRWKDSTDKERLDRNNGLLLSANVDCLFESGLISFDDDGTMLVSSRADHAELKLLGLPRALRANLNAGQRDYMKQHRKRVRI